MPKYADVTVMFPDLNGPGGNAFALIGDVSNALRQHKGAEAAADFRELAFGQCSYEALLNLMRATVNVIE